jgi:hypothetical protein
MSGEWGERRSKEEAEEAEEAEAEAEAEAEEAEKGRAKQTPIFLSPFLVVLVLGASLHGNFKKPKTIMLGGGGGGSCCFGGAGQQRRNARTHVVFPRQNMAGMECCRSHAWKMKALLRFGLLSMRVLSSVCLFVFTAFILNIPSAPNSAA